MPIYTKTGDTGTTAIFGGQRVSKDSAQVRAYGDVDELDSFLGLTLSYIAHKKDIRLLTHIQHDLYQIMSLLSGGGIEDTQYRKIKTRIKTHEQAIDDITITLPKLKNFILMQGNHAATHLHVCRAICRRTERSVVGFLRDDVEIENKYRDLMIQYLNRLSDLLFTLARKYHEGKEVLA